MTNAQYTIERLADRAQIQDVMFRWCRAVDRLDFDAIKAVFHADAVDSHGMFEGGVDALIDWLRERHRTMPFATHSVSNMLIEFSGDDCALVETYCLVAQRHSAEGAASIAAIAGKDAARGRPIDVLAFARYVDRFERRASLWRISHRTVVWDYVTSHEVAESAPQPSRNWTVGRRDSSDFIHRARAELGLPPGM
jgi:hypothetical protein